MIKDKFARELEWAASNVKDHTVELICGKGANEIWRCTNKGSSNYGFDLVISRFGIAMYGDTDSLVFSVGSSYGIEFLARKSVCQYMISKLESQYRDKRELDGEALKTVLVGAGCYLLEQQFEEYRADGEEDYIELPDWVSQGSDGDTQGITLEMVTEEMKKHADEQSHQYFDQFPDYVECLIEERAPDGLQSVESYISEHHEELGLGCEWYEHTISKYSSTLIQRLEMLRLCALKIQEVKNAGDGSEEHAV